MMITYFDIHSHLNFPQFDLDRAAIIKKMEVDGIATVCVGTSLKTSRESIELAEKHSHIWATIGVHPTDWSEGLSESLMMFTSHEKVVAVGECGLDYFRDDTHKREQKELFEAQIKLALSSNLPLMLHGRPSLGSMDAYEDMLEMLESYSRQAGNMLKGHIHFFAGSINIARRFLDLGFTIGFDGPITFAREYDEAIQYIPLDMLCAETDAPFAAPVPFRGKRNSPLHIPYIIEALASIRRENVEVVRNATVINAKRTLTILE